MRTPLASREAGSLINRPVTMRTKARFRHPRTGIAVVFDASVRDESRNLRSAAWAGAHKKA